MTHPKIPVTEDELHAYIDNELPAERRGDVEAWLAAHPDDAERVRSWQSMAEIAAWPLRRPWPTSRCRSGSSSNGSSGSRANGYYGAVAATLVAFVAGGGAGWLAHGGGPPRRRFSRTSRWMRWMRIGSMSSRVRHPRRGCRATNARILQVWLTKRCGWSVHAPELDSTGLKLVGGRLLPGPTGPASFLMYESASGERSHNLLGKGCDRGDPDALHQAGQ